MAKTTKTKKKLSIAELTPQPFKLILTHDEYEDTWVEIVAKESSLDFYLIAAQFTVLEATDYNGQLRLGNKATASAIQAWDEEVFGPFSKEAAEDLLNKPVFWWVRDQINAALQDKSNFFPKA